MKYPVEHREFLRKVELSSNAAVMAAMRHVGAKSVAQFLAWHEMVQAQERAHETRQYRAMKRRGEL